MSTISIIVLSTLFVVGYGAAFVYYFLYKKERNHNKQLLVIMQEKLDQFEKERNESKEPVFVMY